MRAPGWSGPFSGGRPRRQPQTDEKVQYSSSECRMVTRPERREKEPHLSRARASKFEQRDAPKMVLPERNWANQGRVGGSRPRGWNGGGGGGESTNGQRVKVSIRIASGGWGWRSVRASAREKGGQARAGNRRRIEQKHFRFATTNFHSQMLTSICAHLNHSRQLNEAGLFRAAAGREKW
jgi:hypothetical protein